MKRSESVLTKRRRISRAIIKKQELKGVDFNFYE
jgi:hypothetical protein